MFRANYNIHYIQNNTMNTLALATLEALIELELMALATISKLKSSVYKTWQPLAMKWQHLASDNCTENDSQFVLDLPTLPEKVDGFSFEPIEIVLDNDGTVFYLGFCHTMTSDDFADLVQGIVHDDEFNFSRNGFDYPLILPNDINCVKYWFEKYKTNNWELSFDDWFFGDCLEDQVICDDVTIDLSYCEYLTDENFGADVTGYQVAQQLVILFYVWLQSVFVSCLDFLDRVIQIAHNTRYILIYHVTNDDSSVYLDIGETA